ncbi:MAG: hypothetical protein AAGE52_15890 [Myxococcota bacterium]
MTPAKPEDSDDRRSCPRCGNEVVAERYDSGSVQTRLWRCECGWSRALAESGVVSRRGVLDELKRRRDS